MSLPKFPDKHRHPSTFTASDLIRRDPRLGKVRMPDQAILCFQGHLLRHLVSGWRGKPLPAPFGENHALRSTARPVAVAGGFGIGAPVAVFVMEWLIAMGVRRFVLLGYAGGLHESQGPGDLILCTRALRDEGTSHHYLPPDDFAEPDPDLTEMLGRSLRKLGYAHESGPTWTTDAPLRETFPEIEHFRNEGILTVEMEAAALFAAAEFHQIPCAAAFTISDAPKDGRWLVNFDRELLKGGLERLADAAIRTLEQP